MKTKKGENSIICVRIFQFVIKFKILQFNNDHNSFKNYYIIKLHAQMQIIFLPLNLIINQLTLILS
jgi:hypothetical protein